MKRQRGATTMAPCVKPSTFLALLCLHAMLSGLSPALAQGQEKCLGMLAPWSPFIDDGSERALRAGYGGDIGFGDDWIDGMADVDGGRALQQRGRRRVAPFRPLKRLCDKEKRIKKQMSDAEQPLKRCLLSNRLCSESESVVVNASMSLPSVSRLIAKRRPPESSCITVHLQGKCASFKGNPETHMVYRGKGLSSSSLKKIALPGEEMRTNFSTCAVVGNGPGLNGDKARVIDEHDAVFRFNTIQEADRQGHKTTHRVLNNKRVIAYIKRRAIRQRTKVSPGEIWLIWNYTTMHFVSALGKHVQNVRIMSPTLLKRMVDSYFNIRRDLARFGIPMGCSLNMNSGIHGLLLALEVCDTVNVFGFSHTRRMLKEPSLNARMSKHHDWSTDVLIMKLLGMANVINLC